MEKDRQLFIDRICADADRAFYFSYLPLSQMANDTVEWYKTLDKDFHWMLLAGFLAQMVDGALGMGYGVTSATILLSVGVSPAAISGSIHTAEMFAAVHRDTVITSLATLIRNYSKRWSSPGYWVRLQALCCLFSLEISMAILSARSLQPTH